MNMLKYTQKIYLLIIFAGITQGVFAAADDVDFLEIERNIKDFSSRLIEGKIEEGCQVFFKNNSLWKPVDQFNFIFSFKDNIAKLGKPLEIEIIKKKKVSSRIFKVYTLIHLESRPLGLEMLFYKPENRFILINIWVNDKYEEFILKEFPYDK